MGLIKQLVLLPVAPVRFTAWVAEKVAEEADREQYSSGSATQQLDEIEQAREQGHMDEQQAEALEGEVIEQQMARAKPTADREKGAQHG